MTDNLDQPESGASAQGNAGGQFTVQNDGTLVMPSGQRYVPIERYSGLQGKVQQLTNDVTSWKSKYTDISTEAESAKAEIQSKLDTESAASQKLQGDLTALLEQKSELEASATAHQRKVDVLSLVMKDFPELAQGVAKDHYNLGTLEGDELVARLTEIKAERQSLLEAGSQQFSAGESPTTPNGGSSAAPQTTVDDLHQRYMNTPANDPNLQKHYQEWQAAVTQA
jgi:chromosome segregation ATPase